MNVTLTQTQLSEFLLHVAIVRPVFIWGPPGIGKSALVERFAAEVQRVGKGWFITTPNFWYPIEPHYHLPFAQFLPEGTQQRLVRSLGRTPYVHLRLLTRRELRRLFPRGRVMGSRVTFYPETLIAYQAP